MQYTFKEKQLLHQAIFGLLWHAGETKPPVDTKRLSEGEIKHLHAMKMALERELNAYVRGSQSPEPQMEYHYRDKQLLSQVIFDTLHNLGQVDGHQPILFNYGKDDIERLKRMREDLDKRLDGYHKGAVTSFAEALDEQESADDFKFQQDDLRVVFGLLHNKLLDWNKSKRPVLGKLFDAMRQVVWTEDDFRIMDTLKCRLYDWRPWAKSAPQPTAEAREPGPKVYEPKVLPKDLALWTAEHKLAWVLSNCTVLINNVTDSFGNPVGITDVGDILSRASLLDQLRRYDIRLTDKVVDGDERTWDQLKPL